MAKKSYKDYFAFSRISSALILKNLPFIAFLGFMAVMYIANAHYAERNVRQIQLLQREMKDLRREYNSLKAEIMYNQKLTEVKKAVEPLQLEVFNQPPKKVVVDE